MKTININIRVEPILVQEMDLYVKKQSNRSDSITSKSELVRRAIIKFMKEGNI
tara:strand:+ start:670 stop:828 length:159 start_codon:yes stop_codon:yes gene_type:complete